MASDQISKARQARARLAYMPDAIMLGVVSAQGKITITYNNLSWRNYTRAELEGKCCALDSPTK